MIQFYLRIRSSFATFLTNNIYWQKVFENLFDVVASVFINFGAFVIAAKVAHYSSLLAIILFLIGITSFGAFLHGLIRLLISHHKAIMDFHRRWKKLN